MSPLFGKQAAKLFLEEEYKELERQKQLLKSKEERLYRELDAERTRSLNDIQQKTEWFDSHKIFERNRIDHHKEVAMAEIAREKASLQTMMDKIATIDTYIETERAGIKAIVTDAMTATPIAAQMIADCIHAYDMLIAEMLENKPRPAIKAADTIKSYAHAKRPLEEELRLYKYRLSIIEHEFPWLNELFDMTIDDMRESLSPANDSSSAFDSVRRYLSLHEYMSMNDDDRNQLALDRYVSSHKKTKWQIGRDYELYIAHLFRSDGYTVKDTGSLLRFDDLGRDIIVQKNNHVAIIQCKYWSQDKEIHEKHMFQLFGTSMCYQVDHPYEKVSCILVTNTKCSERAKSFARKMNIIVKEGIQIGDYPRIKCNISEDGEYIYHLPMDQQYDNVIIDKPGEFFAMTVQEAVNKGFRRAYRWHGT